MKENLRISKSKKLKRKKRKRGNERKVKDG